MKLRWTVRARRDLLGIGHYIARDNPQAARRWVQRLRERAQEAARRPLAGRVVPEFKRQDIREVLLRNYRVVWLCPAIRTPNVRRHLQHYSVIPAKAGIQSFQWYSQPCLDPRLRGDDGNQVMRVIAGQSRVVYRIHRDAIHVLTVFEGHRLLRREDFSGSGQ